jgi:hypothetical protein
VQGYRLADHIYRPDRFVVALPGLEGADRSEPARRQPPTGSRRDGGTLSQSERDWAWVRKELRAGAAPEALRRTLAERRPDKHDPVDYAQRTVARALSR